MDSGYIRDLFKLDNNLEISKYFCGKIDYKYEKSICIYDLQDEARRNISVAGKDFTTDNKKFSIFIRWNKNYLETSRASEKIYNYLTTLNHLSYNKIDINYIELLNDSPVDLHCGEDGIYERIIDFKIYYKEIK